MKLVAAMMLACGALLLTHAATASSDDTPQMTSYRNDTVRIVKYKFSYKPSDITKGVEEGILKNAGTDAEVLSVTGWFGWKDTHGYVRKLYYVADEKGFRIEGETAYGYDGERILNPHVVASLLGAGGK